MEGIEALHEAPRTMVIIVRPEKGIVTTRDLNSALLEPPLMCHCEEERYYDWLSKKIWSGNGRGKKDLSAGQCALTYQAATRDVQPTMRSH